MIKKTITYVDYNGLERTEPYYFNLTKAEVTEMEYSSGGSLSDKLKAMVEAKELGEMIKFFKWLVLKAYGQKSEDGRRFIKSDALSEAFSQTEAYSELFMELATNDIAAAEFVNGILPNMTTAEQKTLAVSDGASK